MPIVAPTIQAVNEIVSAELPCQVLSSRETLPEGTKFLKRVIFDASYGASPSWDYELKTVDLSKDQTAQSIANHIILILKQIGLPAAKCAFVQEGFTNRTTIEFWGDIRLIQEVDRIVSERLLCVVRLYHPEASTDRSLIGRERLKRVIFDASEGATAPEGYELNAVDLSDQTAEMIAVHLIPIFRQQRGAKSFLVHGGFTERTEIDFYGNTR